MMKMKHIIALCLVLALLMPSTAFAASTTKTKQAPLTIKVVQDTKNPMKVTASYKLNTALYKERNHTWYFGNEFSCHCTKRTYTFKHHGTKTIKIVLMTTKGTKLTASKTIKV